MRNVHGIILAAGLSKRLGSPKQLVSFQGNSLVRHAVLTLSAAHLDSLHVVVPPHLAGGLARHLSDLPCQLVIQPQPEEGLSSSLRVGLDALPPLAPEAGVLVALCDQPLIPAAYFQTLVATYQRTPVEQTGEPRAVATRHGENPGVPAIFPDWLVPALRNLQGDGGARPLLKSLDDLVILSCREAAFDLDTPHDAERLKHEAPV